MKLSLTLVLPALAALGGCTFEVPTNLDAGAGPEEGDLQGPAPDGGPAPDMYSRPPAARLRPGMAYDPLRRRTVLFGGLGQSAPLGDLAELDAVGFLAVERGPRWPAAREGHALSFDGQSVLLFGGQREDGLSSETFSWDGRAFAPRNLATRPGPRTLHAMSYDSARRRVVLFGGAGEGAVSSDDTWEWDGAAWAERTPQAPPTAREGAAMAYDARRQRTVLFGGLYDGDTYSPRTYLWDGAEWTATPYVPMQAPPARAYFGMAYDEARERAVLFGGETTGSTALGDTWEWDGAAWTRRTTATAPAARTNHRMVYDAGRKAVLLYGGVSARGLEDDVWALDGAGWTKLSF